MFYELHQIVLDDEVLLTRRLPTRPAGCLPLYNYPMLHSVFVFDPLQISDIVPPYTLQLEMIGRDETGLKRLLRLCSRRRRELLAQSSVGNDLTIFHQKEKRIKLRHRHLMTTSFVAQHSQRTRASSFSSCTSTRRRPLTCFCTRVLHRGVCPVVAC